MAQYVDKAALLEYLNQLYEKHSTLNSVDEGGVVINDIEYFLDTLEVKEVDLEKEIKANQESDEVKIGETQICLDDDGGEPPYDGKQWLDLSCMEYEIPSDKFKDGDNVEIFIRKAMKGE